MWIVAHPTEAKYRNVCKSYVLFEIAHPEPCGFGLILAHGLLYLGWLLMGATILRTRLLPRPAVILLIVVSLVNMLLSLTGAMMGLSYYLYLCASTKNQALPRRN